MSSWIWAPLAHCTCHSYPLIEGVVFEGGLLIITMLLWPLVIRPNSFHWQAQSHLGPANPEAWGRESEQFGQKCWTTLKMTDWKGREQRRRTFELMVGKREGRKWGWGFNLEIHASCGYSWAVSEHRWLDFSYLQCRVLTSDNGFSLRLSPSSGESLDNSPTTVATSQRTIRCHTVGGGGSGN